MRLDSAASDRPYLFVAAVPVTRRAQMLSLVTDPLLALLYPEFCGTCGLSVEKASFAPACRACWSETRVFGPDDPLCLKCGDLLDGISKQTFSTCGVCSDHLYDTARAAGPYEKALLTSVLRLKTVPRVAAFARERLIDTFDGLGMRDEFVIIPVPLSKHRLLERGFNQASLLADVIARHTGRPIDEYSLIRDRHTAMHRAAMDQKARDAAVKNAFKVVRPNLIKGRQILLVDDVMTSGSTVSHCAKELKKHGAEKVIVLTLSRTVRFRNAT